MYGIMHRTTVYLPDDLKRALEQQARESGVSEAELIREGVRIAVLRHAPLSPHAGVFASGDSNLSERTDDLLEGFGES